jgi:hypothetical protein
MTAKDIIATSFGTVKFRGDGRHLSLNNMVKHPQYRKNHERPDDENKIQIGESD